MNLDGTFHISYEDGDEERNKSAAFLRELSAKEQRGPRNCRYGKLWWSKKHKQWTAFYRGKRRVPGRFASIEAAESALVSFHAQQQRPKERRTSVSSSSSSLGRYGGMIKRPPQTDSNAPSTCAICLEMVTDGDDHALRTQCCFNWFHQPCLDLQEQVRGKTSTCPTCRNSTAFHRQLRAVRRLQRYGQGADGGATDAGGGGGGTGTGVANGSTTAASASEAAATTATNGAGHAEAIHGQAGVDGPTEAGANARGKNKRKQPSDASARPRTASASASTSASASGVADGSGEVELPLPTCVPRIR